ncbi:hypothetical protein DFP93_105147 [Aneurinibacillus soli]|uniref:Uncharacterized protein n=1 Tax=Aneurinibacillus soli TaxID=1500254 RepID=A0A0U4WJ71_9BACL|nr:DUF309 domain-containing protein [Aneurinibacillus soli]PYE62193.1 hypothetical protein DFP93_105147 [Aneurinibacillus soli]BAU28619.1 hypothetical protein CB4_02794 [Aneurinibacillus soli]
MTPKALLDYLVYFHAERDYFECHEVLEEYWKSLSSEQNRDVWVGLIQIAVGLYHQRRGNITGAKKILAASLTRLTPAELDWLGFAGDLLRDAIIERLHDIEAGLPYADLNLPLRPKLAAQCEMQCAMEGRHWLSPTNFADPFLIHKHKLRDRSAVIAERERRLSERTPNNQSRIDKPSHM